MRGVIAAGMVAGLEELGLTYAFDAVFGSSAGAICGAYFLANQAALGVRIFSEDINNRRFASRARGLVGGAIINLDFLVDDVMVRVKPLDADAVLSSPVKLSVLATDVTSGGPAVSAISPAAASCVPPSGPAPPCPLFQQCLYPFRGRPYFDASLTEPIPLVSTDAEGFTHIVVLLTRPRGVPRNVSLFDRWVVAPRLRHYSPPLAARFLSGARPTPRCRI